MLEIHHIVLHTESAFREFKLCSYCDDSFRENYVFSLCLLRFRKWTRVLLCLKWVIFRFWIRIETRPFRPDLERYSFGRIIIAGANLCFQSCLISAVSNSYQGIIIINKTDKYIRRMLTWKLKIRFKTWMSEICFRIDFFFINQYNKFLLNYSLYKMIIYF